jgi:putative aldouronate transport system permease protein
LTVFRKIVCPLSLPILATIAVFSLVGQWNSWTDNFFLVSKRELQTIQNLLWNYLNNQGQMIRNTLEGGVASRVSTPQLKMTITVIATIPIMFAYPILQRYFVKGIMLGAIKG